MQNLKKYSLLIFLLLITSVQAEMKCEAGKCSSGKDLSKKEIIKKEMLQEKREIKTKEIKTNTVDKPLKKQRPTVKQLFNVRTTKVIRKHISHIQTNYGFIVVQEPFKMDVVAWYSGYVEELYANKLYKEVKEGEVLAKVYSPEVYKAKQEYLNAIKFSAKRPSHVMVKSSRVKLELLNVCKKEIEDIEKTQKVDKLTTIFSPSSGWIFEKNINKGSSFNSKKKLFQIVDLSKVWMEVKLYQNELQKIDTLKEFNVKINGFEQIFKATKPLLYPIINPKEATATLRLSIDNKEGILKPGMYAKVSASTDLASRLLIPRTAVMRKNGTWYVFLETEFKGEYEPVHVEVKPLDNKYFELISGLNEGDSVVDNALFMMDSDAQINGIY